MNTTSNVTIEQVGSWLSSPVTQTYMQVLKNNIDAARTDWTDNLDINESKDDLFFKKIQLQTVIDIAEQFIEIAKTLHNYNVEVQGDTNE